MSARMQSRVSQVGETHRAYLNVELRTIPYSKTIPYGVNLTINLTVNLTPLVNLTSPAAHFLILTLTLTRLVMLALILAIS